MNTFYFSENERYVLVFSCVKAYADNEYSQDVFNKYCLENNYFGEKSQFSLKIQYIINILDSSVITLTSELKSILIYVLKYRSEELRGFYIKKEDFEEHCKTHNLSTIYIMYQYVEAILKKIENT